MMGERNENSDLLVRSRMTKVFLIGVKKNKKNDDQGGRGVAVRRLRAQGRPQHLVRPRGDQPRQRVLWVHYLLERVQDKKLALAPSVSISQRLLKKHLSYILSRELINRTNILDSPIQRSLSRWPGCSNCWANTEEVGWAACADNMGVSQLWVHQQEAL